MTVYIISRDRRFLVGVPFWAKGGQWSDSPYDAAQITDANDARRVADRVGGNVHKFNPLTGEVV